MPFKAGIHGQKLMNKRNVLILGVLAIWAGLLVLVFKVSLDRLAAPAWGNAVGTTRSAELASGIRVGQQFVAPWPGLHRVDVTIDQAGRDAKGQVTFRLTDDSGQELWVETVDAAAMQSTGVQAFEFPPLGDSKGQSYAFSLESSEANSEEAIALGYSPGSTLESATALVNGQPTDGSLQFNTYYSLRTRDRVGLLLFRLVDGRSYLPGSKAFYTGLAAIYGVALAVFLWLAIRTIVQEQKRT